MKHFFNRLWTLLDARNKEFYRDRAAMGWNIIFPVLVVMGFGFAFKDDNGKIFKVATVPALQDVAEEPNEFLALKHVEYVKYDDVESALAKLKLHKVDMVFSGKSYWINSTSPNGYLLEKILKGAGNNDTQYIRQTVEGKEIRYVDWLVSGLLGMNMMFSALFGVGYTVVRYRKNGVLKRLKATPLGAFEFLFAQLASRLIVLVAISTVVYIGCNAVIHFQMLGSYLDLFLVLVLGAMSLIAMGLVVAARTDSEELAGGLLNLISWPMMFLSGVWFSLEGAHPWVQRAADLLPLTHVINGARAIMTEGAGLMDISYHIIALIVMTALMLIAGVVSFRWG